MKTMKTLIIIFLMALCPIHSFSQTILINGHKSDGKLAWSDFTGKVNQSASFNAYTAYTFSTKTESVHFVGDSAVIEGFDAILKLDKKNTWAKKDKVTDELLVHEQGHFDLGILCVREIMKKVKETKFTQANLNSRLNKIINDTSKKYNKLGLKYDKETNHSKNLKQQRKWNEFFKEKLSN